MRANINKDTLRWIQEFQTELYSFLHRNPYFTFSSAIFHDTIDKIYDENSSEENYIFNLLLSSSNGNEVIFRFPTERELAVQSITLEFDSSRLLSRVCFVFTCGCVDQVISLTLDQLVTAKKSFQVFDELINKIREKKLLKERT